MRHNSSAPLARLLYACLPVLAGLLAPGSAQAQSVHRPSDSRVVVGDWTFVPIDEVQPGSRHVHSVLALRDKATASGSNLVSIWYEPPAAGQPHWTAKCWESQDQWEAIKNLKVGLSIGDEYDGLWPTEDQHSAAPPFEIPKDYVKGFALTDQNGQAINQSAERDLLVAAFTEWGYQSADLAFEKDAYACGADAFLDNLKAAWEEIYASKTSSVEDGAAIVRAHMEAACEVDVSQTTTTPPSRTVPGTTVTIPSNCDWYQTSPYWAAGGTKRDADSDTTGTCCYKREFYILIICRQGGFFWTHWPWHYDIIKKYSWFQPFCCPNRNMGECPTTPDCLPPAVNPTPGPSDPVIGPDKYYPDE